MLVLFSPASGSPEFSFCVTQWQGNYPVALPLLRLAVCLLAESIISHQGMAMTASYGYKSYKSPAVVGSSLPITEAHADTFTFVSA